MRVGEQGARRGRELLMAGFLKAEIEPGALVLGRGSAAHLLDVRAATRRAAHYAVRPAHLLHILKALFFRGKLYVDFADIDGLGVLSCGHVFILHKHPICVK